MKHHADNNTILHGAGLMAARAAWLVIVLLSTFLLVLGTWDKFHAPLASNCAVVACNPIEITADDVAFLNEREIPGGLFTILLPVLNLLFNVGFLIVALVLGWRKSDDWVALLLSATLAILGGVAFSPANDVLIRTRPEFETLGAILQTPAYSIIGLFLFIFPDGRFVPRWLGWIAIPASALVAWSYLDTVLLVVTVVLGALVVYSHIYRFRRVSGAVERQQTKWGLLGIACAFGISLMWGFAATAIPPQEPSLTRTVGLLVLWPILIACGIAMPLCFAVAILRYRLWDIDLIIRRTLIYTLVTLGLLIVYLGSVVLLQSVFRALTGQQSDLAIVVSTLAIAALFTPLRRRIQTLIDRRFYRRRYNAQRTLGRFMASLRDERSADLDHMTDNLLQAISETMQPAYLSLWLKASEAYDG